MKSLLSILLLVFTLTVFSQNAKVTHVAAKFTNLQMWSDVDWIEVNSKVKVTSETIEFCGIDTTILRILSEPIEIEKNTLYTDGLTEGGVYVRLKLKFARGHLIQIYILAVPRLDGQLLARSTELEIDEYQLKVNQYNQIVRYIDLVFQMNSNEIRINNF